MEDINSAFDRKKVLILQIRRTEAEALLLEKKQRRLQEQQKEVRDNGLYDECEMAFIDMRQEVGKALSSPNKFSDFVDKIAKSRHIGLEDHLYDVSPISIIGEMPSRECSLESLTGDSNTKARQVPNFKASYALIRISGVGEGEERINLALAVASQTHLKDPHDFEIDIPKYELVCFKQKNRIGGIVDTSLVSPRVASTDFLLQLRMFARASNLCEAVLENYGAVLEEH